MNRTAFFNAIDRAMVKAAEAAFKTLCNGKAKGEVATRVNEVLNALALLSDGISPDYSNPWVAPFYLTWYQPGHIVLASRLIRQLNMTRGGSAILGPGYNSLRVVDFGCGTVPMQFALAWAGATAIEEAANLERVNVESCDIAEPMVRMGISAWNQFKLEIKNEPDLKPLVGVSKEIIAPRYWLVEKMPPLQEREPGQERWLTAMHAVYQKTLPFTKESFDGIAVQFAPHVTLLTCHQDSSSEQRLNDFFPSGGDPYTPPDSSGVFAFEMATDWRCKINKDWSVDHPYLNRTVTTGCDASGLIHLKK